VDAQAEAARVAPAGQVATAVNPANLAGSRWGAASMTPGPYRNVEIPRVGRDVDSQQWPASDAYQAAGEAHESSRNLEPNYGNSYRW
jgi:hypothetical protein